MDGIGENPRKLPLEMLQVSKRARLSLWLCSSQSTGFIFVDGLSIACVSEMAQRFLFKRAWDRSTIPAQTTSVHFEQVSHLLSIVHP